jgi:hypothetical protein
MGTPILPVRRVISSDLTALAKLDCTNAGLSEIALSG